MGAAFLAAEDHPFGEYGQAAQGGGAVGADASPLAFYALCSADPFAWIAADSVLSIPFLRNIMRKDYGYMYRHTRHT